MLVATTQLCRQLRVCVSRHWATKVGASKSAPWTLLMGAPFLAQNHHHSTWRVAPHRSTCHGCSHQSSGGNCPPRKSLALTHLLPCRKESSPHHTHWYTRAWMPQMSAPLCHSHPSPSAPVSFPSLVPLPALSQSSCSSTCPHPSRI